jgi:signal transduction histidine kinase
MSVLKAINGALVVQCGSGGSIESIILDPGDLAGARGSTFHELLKPDAAAEAANLLAEALEFGFASRRELGLRSTSVKWHFVGAATGNGHVVILAAATQARLVRLCQAPPGELVCDTTLSEEIKRAGARMYEQGQADLKLIEELAQLNSEMSGIQRELAKRNAELAHKEIERNRLIGFVAHDLRNPLGVINGYADLLLEDAQLSAEERSQYLEGIARSGQTVLRMANDLLDLMKIESGELSMELCDFSIAEVVLSHIELNRMQAQSKRIALKCEVESAPKVVRIDPVRIGQVLDNLLTNAIKFSEPGDEVTVRVDRRDELVVIEVADQGVGIPADEIGHLFQPFGRTSARPTGGESSTGLGLAISQRIVAAHRGRIEVESALGAGTTFRVVIPVVAAGT